jgi:hypothetical protein
MRIAIVLMSVMFLMCGCDKKSPETAGAKGVQGAKGAESTTESAQKLIKRYNQLLSDGYRTLNMNPLQEVATPELAQKAYYHMAALGEGTNRMNSTLKQIDFLAVDTSKPGAVRVSTKETWDFSYLDIKTGAKSNEVKDYVYYVTYLIEPRDNRWLLTEINASGEERKELPSWRQMLQDKQKKAP